ncbi:MAG: pre-toxin TG domain-containing protein, partial [Acidimicrobiales bacterium]
ASPAAADNCSVFTDCFNQANAASEAAFGLLLLAGLSLALDFLPVVGTAKSGIEAVTGRDLLTGEELADWERSLGLVPFLPVGLVRGAGGVDDLAGVVRRGEDLADPLAPGGRAAGASPGRAWSTSTPSRPPRRPGAGPSPSSWARKAASGPCGRPPVGTG